jgi:hypothetical protein
MTLENVNPVVETPGGTGTESTAVVTPQTVSSSEVKTEVQPTVVQNNDGVSAKMQEQIENLNKALRQEREASKMTAQELKEKLESSQETINKLKDVFSPKQPEPTAKEELTMAQIEKLLNDREESKRIESQKEKQMIAIKEEIATLEKEFDGVGGKPVYDDKKVLKWQEDNDKLYLSPRDAFLVMNKDEIINWEIKNKLNQRPVIQNVVTPGGSVEVRSPQQTPVNTADLRSAVLEAMEIAGNENIN